MNAIDQIRLLQEPAAQAIGWALLQFVWQGALVGVLSALALVALRRSAADVRYVVATIGLTLMLTMPVVTARAIVARDDGRRRSSGRCGTAVGCRRVRVPLTCRQPPSRSFSPRAHSMALAMRRAGDSAVLTTPWAS